jgi:hypothetical protein
MTHLFITPVDYGITTLTFTNDYDAQTFMVLVIVV